MTTTDNRRSLAATIGVFAGLALLPWLTGSYTLAVLIDVYIFAVFALSYNLLIGYTGVLSFGHALFFGLGAYSMAIPLVRLSWPVWQAVAAGLGLSVAAALVLGGLSLRVRGVYFTMVTLAFAEIAHVLALKLSRFTGGEDGITRIPVPTFLNDRTNFYYFALLLLATVYAGMRVLVSSPFGRTLVAIRENEVRAAMLGYNVFAHKLAAMIIAGVVATAAGMVNALFFNYVSPGALSIFTTIDVLLMTIVGGVGTLAGPILGAGVVQALNTFLSTIFRHWLLVFGLIYVVIVMFLPKGIIGTVAERLEKRRVKRAVGAGPDGTAQAADAVRPGGSAGGA